MRKNSHHSENGLRKTLVNNLLLLSAKTQKGINIPPEAL